MDVLWVYAVLYAVCSCPLISRFMIYELVKYVYDAMQCYSNEKPWKNTIPVGLFSRDQSIIHSHCICTYCTVYTIRNSHCVSSFFVLAPVCFFFVCLSVCLLSFVFFLNSISDSRTHSK